jgi:hypothetical protein
VARDHLSNSDALRKLRECLKSGLVQFHPHLKKRRKQRCIDLQDVLFVLRRGIIRKPAELNLRFQQWRYTVEGRPPDGPVLEIIIAFLEEDGTLVLTVMVP